MAFNAVQMPVGDLTGDAVVRIDPTASLLEASIVMVRDDVGAIVIGTSDDVCGIVSERDVIRAAAESRDLSTTPVSAVASTELTWAKSTAPIDDVAAQMMGQWIRHILVEQDGELIGVVSARDILGVMASAN